MLAPSWGALFGFAVGTRALTLLLGYLAAHHLPPLAWIETQQYVPDSSSLVMTFHRWDASYYMEISRSGYTYTPGQYCTAAFMPLLPALIAVAKMFGMNPYLAGVVIPNVCFCVGLMIFGRATLLATKNAATVWKACALLSAAPTAFFFSCPYQESLAFLSMSLAWWAWLMQRPGLAAAGVFAGCLARLTSLVFPAALALEWLMNAVRRKSNRSLVSILIIGAAGVLAVALFCLYMQQNVGDPLAHMKAHAAWNRKPPALRNIPYTLEVLYYHYPRDGQYNATVMAGSSLIVFTLLGLRAWRVRGAFAGAMIMLPLVQALSTGTPMSLERIVLASFMASIDLAELLKRGWWFWSVLAFLFLVQCILLNGYVHYQFVG